MKAPSEYKTAILSLFSKYNPGMKINRPALVSLVVDELYPMGTLKTGTDLMIAKEEVMSFLDDDKALGEQSMLVWSKGKFGGGALRPDLPATQTGLASFALKAISTPPCASSTDELLARAMKVVDDHICFPVTDPCMHESHSAVQVPTRNERPCHGCQRNNDVGSAKCWWCEASNPAGI